MTATRRRPILVGTSGFSYPAWRGGFYPEKLPGREMLRFYASVFRSVEINLTFRVAPTAAALRTWREQTPAGFRFVCKAPQQISHRLRLNPPAAAAATDFWSQLAVLGAQRGPVLFQLPPNMKADTSRLEAFLAGLPPDLEAAFEFRHASWFTDATFTALRARRAVLCLADAEHLTTPVVATGPFGFLRLRRDAYDVTELARWAAIARDTRGWRRTFVFFKHEDEGRGPRFARQFVDLLG